MEALHLMTVSAATFALAISATSAAEAQRRAVGGGLRLPPPAPAPIGEFHGFSGVIVVEREVPVIIEREVVVREVPAAAANLGTLNRDVPKPYVIGSTYASLPGGCMKMIEGGVSYYYCGGDWYRQVGKLYRAVKREL